MTAPIGELDRVLLEHGFRRVAGVDEAGRGALAGPLVAAAVILPPGWMPEGLRDSKLLTPLQRDRLYDEITERAVAWAVRRVTPQRLDRVGLQRANVIALTRAVAKLEVEPDYVLADGRFRLRLPVASCNVVKGDMVSSSIAAASILAKVTRDRMMVRLSRRVPGYGFAEHKGYSCPSHRRALEQLGPSEVHRRCFATVAQLAIDLDDGTPMEGELGTPMEGELGTPMEGGLGQKGELEW